MWNAAQQRNPARRYGDTLGKGVGAGIKTWSEGIYKRPAPEKVAELAQSHGFAACCERWGFIPTESIKRMIVEGNRRRRRAQAA